MQPEFAPPQRSNSPYIRISEAEREFGIPRRTLYNAIRKRQLGAYKFGGIWYLTTADVEAWKERCYRRPSAEGGDQ